MKLVLPLHMIKDEVTITKVTGQKEYTVRREIKIFGCDGTKSIKCDPGAVFLVDQNGNANALSDTAEVAISFSSACDLIAFLQEYNEEEFIEAVKRLP